jgi:hypothetical protein
MKSNFTKRTLACSLTTLGVIFASAHAQADQNPSIGTWKLNLEKSIPPQGQKFHSYTVVIKSAAPELHYEYVNTDENGKEVTFSFKGSADGTILDLSGPGFEGMTDSMTLLPSGIIDAKLWLPDGTYENKFCIMGVGLRKQTCLATVTSPRGDVVFFKQVLDKQD